jgi:phage-related protein
MHEDRIFKMVTLGAAHDFLISLEEMHRSKIASCLIAIRNRRFNTVHVKTLKGKIKELIVNEFRVVFFIEVNTVYVVRGFVKKSSKTPLGEIEQAEKAYRHIISYK